MLRNHVLDDDIAFGDRCGKHISTRLNHVRHNAVGASVELLHSVDADHIGAGALDVRAHTVKEIGRIYHMGLLGRILDDRPPVSPRGGHHDVDGCADRHDVQKDMRAMHGFAPRDNGAVGDAHVRADRAETFQMLINGAAADIAPAGKRNLRLVVFSKKRTQQIVRGADLLDTFVIHAAVPDRRTVDPNGVTADALHMRANLADGLQKNVDIIDIRKVFQSHRLIRHDGCGQNRKRCVFRTGNLYFSNQRNTAFDDILFHEFASFPLSSDFWSGVSRHPHSVKTPDIRASGRLCPARSSRSAGLLSKSRYGQRASIGNGDPLHRPAVDFASS